MRDTDKGDDGGGPPSLTGPGATLDPLNSLADGIAKSAAWTVDQLSNAVSATSDIDFTNTAFLKTYALVFAASAFLVLLLWLWAVVKRAVRGVPLTQALGEAIGLLWVTVLASAFTPLILYTIVGAVDGITEALAGGGSGKFFDAFSDALRDDQAAQDGGPFARIVLSLVSILAAGVVWLEMVVRSALLYVGAVLGLVVYSGIVDRQLWSRVRKWAGIMAAIILLKPIIVVVLRLASAMAEGGEPKDTTAAIISGLAIIIIAIVASALLFRFVPGMGDEIVAARRDTYDPASRQAAAVVTKPVTGITQGINTHASRDVAARPAASPSVSASSSASGGIAAHSTRPTSSGSGSSGAGVPRQDGQDRTGRG
ncbi:MULTISPECIES: hypothetical protein [unclassified Streptomyces]|uniref:hypothetical protein n=1 Tax=unclassified Streptomyces TaxID=2593676 RepID=UPI000BCA14DE|nr:MULTISPECIES: hypothetical protein [unclassified Streptomyces]SOE08238.1 hypothetical protein SAMN06272727_7730 [Streptomyces sp. Ag82_G6-1]